MGSHRLVLIASLWREIHEAGVGAVAFTCELWVRPSIESSAGLRIVSDGNALGPRTVLVSKKLTTCKEKLTLLTPSHQVYRNQG